MTQPGGDAGLWHTEGLWYPGGDGHWKFFTRREACPERVGKTQPGGDAGLWHTEGLEHPWGLW